MMRLFQMFAGFLLLWHWVGCVWIFVCLLEEEDGLINESNIWHIGAFERDLSDNPWPDEHKWAFAVYWGMCVTLGIGFDIVPSTQVETIYTLFCSGGGIFMFAFIVWARPPRRSPSSTRLGRSSASGSKRSSTTCTLAGCPTPSRVACWPTSAT